MSHYESDHSAAEITQVQYGAIRSSKGGHFRCDKYPVSGGHG
eukprot:CAMPEP_0119469130 /NCGR_PEP_ID=MMETSP1344-20130328/2597_1 /TAXON_ID=236787 /ORGANISM="Florenciella parvula, Strain CCMP2471" /LENGTH=41 /DNA_ID= /DNA_START= /DNA_END= /DNA_ORIENTATION=